MTAQYSHHVTAQSCSRHAAHDARISDCRVQSACSSSELHQSRSRRTRASVTVQHSQRVAAAHWHSQHVAAAHCSSRVAAGHVCQHLSSTVSMWQPCPAVGMQLRATVVTQPQGACVDSCQAQSAYAAVRCSSHVAAGTCVDSCQAQSACSSSELR
jgi:hypothetical protein